MPAHDDQDVSVVASAQASEAPVKVASPAMNRRHAAEQVGGRPRAAGTRRR